MARTASAIAMEQNRLLPQFKCTCFNTDFCDCTQKTASAAYFNENVRDVAKTLADVMVICGIHEAKAKAAIDLIVCAFMHYDEIRHKIDAPPKKRLCREDLMHDLGRKCLMTRMEAQLTYSIIKRAFKAFYHGTTEGSIRNRALEAKLLHTQECVWVHAAKRTAQVFASYEGLFLLAQKAYEAQIKCAYKKLYDKLTARKFPLSKPEECACQMCVKNRLGDIHSVKSSKKYDLVYYRSAIQLHLPLREDMLLPTASCAFVDTSESTMTVEHTPHKPEKSKIDFNLPMCYKCKCPKLVCDCDIDPETGVLCTDCSQGPYQCEWVRIEEDELRSDPCITMPEDHECPIDCASDGTSEGTCDDECECDCESCECDCMDEDDAFSYEDQETLESEEGVVELENEEPDPEPVIDLPEMSQRPPSQHYGGCHVPMNHIIEETTVTNRPSHHAAVEEHPKHARLMSTDVVPAKKKSLSPEKSPSISGGGKTGKRPQQSQDVRKEIKKLMGELL